MESDLVPDNVALNSYILYAILSAVALSSLARSAFAIVPDPVRVSLIRVGGGAPWNSGRRRSSTHPTSAPRRKVILRDWILFLSGISLVIDCINKLVAIIQIRQTGTTNFLAYNLTDLFGLQNIMFLVCAAIVHRCSIIVLADSKNLRRKALWVFGLLWVALFLEHKIIYVSVVLQMAQANATPYEWFNSHIIPRWLLFQIGLLPVIVTISSGWSIWVAFGQQKAAATPSSGYLFRASRKVKQAFSSRAVIQSTSATAEEGVPSLTPSNEQHHQQHASSATSEASTPMTPKAKSIQAPLTSSFYLLSFLMILSYVLYVAVSLTVESQVPVISGGWTSVVLNFTIAAELSFDSVLRWSRARAKSLRGGGGGGHAKISKS